MNRPWRRWGTDRLIRTFVTIAAEFRAAHPGVPRLVVGDVSRPRGGPFGKRFGGIGHSSHQNGLDIDIYYPRIDRLERRPGRPALVDVALARDLVARVVAAGSEFIFVGVKRFGGVSRRGVAVQPLVNHEDHLHVRLPARAATQERLAAERARR